MHRKIKFLVNQKIDNKRRLLELLPSDEIAADDDSIMIAFFREEDSQYVVIPDATPAQVWEEWVSQFCI